MVSSYVFFPFRFLKIMNICIESIIQESEDFTIKYNIPDGNISLTVNLVCLAYCSSKYGGKSNISVQ